MRITRNLAYSIADILTKKNKDAVAIQRKEVEALAIKEYEQYIPAEVSKVASSCPSWIKKVNYISVNYSIDDSNETFYAYAPKATIITKGGEASLKLNSKSALRRKIINYVKAHEACRDLRREVVRTVQELATSAKVIEQFPETAALFKAKKAVPPTPQKIDLSELKSKLQKQ